MVKTMEELRILKAFMMMMVVMMYIVAITMMMKKRLKVHLMKNVVYH